MKKCNFCGKCRQFCPVFKAQKIEKYSPRARLASFDLSDNKSTSSVECILCGNCKNMCPFNIFTPKHIINFDTKICANIEKNRDTVFVNTTGVSSKLFQHDSIGFPNFFDDLFSANIIGVKELIETILSFKRAVFYDESHKNIIENIIEGSGVEFINYVDYLCCKDSSYAKEILKYKQLSDIIEYKFIPVSAYIKNHKAVALKIVKNNQKKEPEPNYTYFSCAIEDSVINLLKESGINAVRYTDLL